MFKQEVKVTPWAFTGQPAESQILQMFAAEDLRPYRWSNGPHDVYSAHTHAFDKVIIVVQGSITFGLPQEGRQVDISAGDRLDLPQGTLHNATVGPEGVVCLEAHR